MNFMEGCPRDCDDGRAVCACWTEEATTRLPAIATPPTMKLRRCIYDLVTSIAIFVAVTLRPNAGRINWTKVSGSTNDTELHHQPNANSDRYLRPMDSSARFCLIRATGR